MSALIRDYIEAQNRAHAAALTVTEDDVIAYLHDRGWRRGKGTAGEPAMVAPDDGYPIPLASAGLMLRLLAAYKRHGGRHA